MSMSVLKLMGLIYYACDAYVFVIHTTELILNEILIQIFQEMSSEGYMAKVLSFPC